MASGLFWVVSNRNGKTVMGKWILNIFHEVVREVVSQEVQKRGVYSAKTRCLQLRLFLWEHIVTPKKDYRLDIVLHFRLWND